MHHNWIKFILESLWFQMTSDQSVQWELACSMMEGALCWALSPQTWFWVRSSHLLLCDLNKSLWLCGHFWIVVSLLINGRKELAGPHLPTLRLGVYRRPHLASHLHTFTWAPLYNSPRGSAWLLQPQMAGDVGGKMGLQELEVKRGRFWVLPNPE